MTAEYSISGKMVVLNLYTQLPYAEMSFLELISWPMDNIYHINVFVFHIAFKEKVIEILTNLDIQIVEKENAELQY